MIKICLAALLAAFFACAAAIAGEQAVEVDGVRYEMKKATEVVVLQAGEVKQVDWKCETIKRGFNSTTTCAWAKTLTATSDGIVVTDGGTSTKSQLRIEIIALVISVGMMVCAIALVYFSAAAFAAAAAATIAAVATLATIAAVAPVIIAIIVALAAGIAAGIAIDAADGKNKKIFNRAACVHIALMMLVLWLVY